MGEAPRRRVKLELRLGADSWEDAADSLRQIALEIEMGKHRRTVVSGGNSAGYVFEASEDESITHEGFVAANAEYVRSLAAEDAPTPSEPHD